MTHLSKSINGKSTKQNFINKREREREREREKERKKEEKHKVKYISTRKANFDEAKIK